MPWIALTAQATVVAVAFWAPGAAVLMLIGARGVRAVRGVLLVALAPGVTAGLFGLGAVVVGLAGVPWTGVSAAVALVAACAVAWRWPTRARATDPSLTSGAAVRRLVRRPGAGALVVGGAVTVGALLQLVPLVAGMRSPTSLLDGHDQLFHLTVLQFVRETGLASSFRLSAVAGDTLDGRFYPGAWHAVAAVVPVVADRGALLTTAAIVPACVAWVAGLAALARTAFLRERAVTVVAPLLAVAGTAPPVLLVLQAGIVANAFALALAPGALAWLTCGRAHRRAGLPVSAAILAGLALAHPGTFVVVLVLALPGWVALLRRGVADRRRRLLASAGAVIAVASVATAIALAAPSDYGRYGGSTAWSSILGDLGTGAVGLGVSDGTVLVVAAVVGAVLAARAPGSRWLVASGVLVTLGYVVLRLRLEATAQAVAPWYGEPRRIGPVFSALLVVLAALALVRLARTLADRRVLQTTAEPAVVAAALALAVTAVPLVQGVTSMHAQSAAGFGWRDGSPRLDPEVLALARRTHVDGRVLGSPATGAAHAYGLAGQDVVLRSPWSEPSADVRTVADGLVHLGSDPEVCAALDRLGVSHLWVDTASRGTAEPVLDVVPARGVREVDAAGTVRLLQVTGC